MGLHHLPRPPLWAWLTAAALLLTPFYLRYFAWAVGGCVSFWAPLR